MEWAGSVRHADLLRLRDSAVKLVSVSGDWRNGEEAVVLDLWPVTRETTVMGPSAGRFGRVGRGTVGQRRWL